MMHLAYISLGLSCPRFAELLESVSLLPNVEILQSLFLHVTFKPHHHYLPLLGLQ